MKKTKSSRGLVLVSLLMAWSAAWAADAITGVGSSAAAPIYRSWAQEYSKATGVTFNYETASSSVGLHRIREKAADFAGSELIPSEAELARDGLVMFPVAITGVVPVVNLPKLADGQLRLNGEILARIFLGEISNWGDNGIAELNPGLALPKMPIKVIVRTAGSGTAFTVADYLGKVSPAWRAKHGAAANPVWQDGVVQAKGSEDVIAAVKNNPGAIAYVDFGYVAEHQLNAVQLKNVEGDFVRPSSAAFRVALANSVWASKGTFNTTLTDMPGKGAWPLTMGTFAVLPKVSDRPEQTRRALKFLAWAFTNGDALVHKHNFVRLSDRVQSVVFRTMAGVKDAQGNPIGLF